MSLNAYWFWLSRIGFAVHLRRASGQLLVSRKTGKVRRPNQLRRLPRLPGLRSTRNVNCEFVNENALKPPRSKQGRRWAYVLFARSPKRLAIGVKLVPPERNRSDDKSFGRSGPGLKWTNSRAVPNPLILLRTWRNSAICMSDSALGTVSSLRMRC